MLSFVYFGIVFSESRFLNNRHWNIGVCNDNNRDGGNCNFDRGRHIADNRISCGFLPRDTLIVAGLAGDI